jgi:hypothetical protein
MPLQTVSPERNANLTLGAATNHAFVQRGLIGLLGKP